MIDSARSHLTLFRSGKVRDTYRAGEDTLLMVASDRISAFDVILPTPIPDKGRILTQLSAFWFARTEAIVPNHLISADSADFPAGASDEIPDLAGRGMLVRRAERIDVECVVRGYLAGSAWREYGELGTVAGQPLPTGLRQSEKLDEPLFTPAIKNDSGHDENISIARLRSLIGAETASRLEAVSRDLYDFAAPYALARGIILADTKFEFGWIDGRLHLIDEILTPDSSRFWDATTYEPGGDQASFDKQPVRDWLVASGWNKEPPAPTLPDDIVRGTRARYQEAFDRLTSPETAEK